MIEAKLDLCKQRVRTSGFTLVELMVVVAIVGVLAAIGISLFRKHVDSARSVEATNMIQAIRAAQEAYRAETQRYLRASTALTSYYPRATPTRERVSWEAAYAEHDDGARWQRLNVTTLGQVQCVYSTVAGSIGSSPDDEALAMFDGPLPTFGDPTEPWYMIHARADVDGDSHADVYLATNLNGEVYVESSDD
jgi:prepilin-type N-terminal cleavage/methylation domain-containing protein